MSTSSGGFPAVQVPPLAIEGLAAEEQAQRPLLRPAMSPARHAARGGQAEKERPRDGRPLQRPQEPSK
jgi:hypothetical protein